MSNRILNQTIQTNDLFRKGIYTMETTGELLWAIFLLASGWGLYRLSARFQVGSKLQSAAVTVFRHVAIPASQLEHASPRFVRWASVVSIPSVTLMLLGNLWLLLYVSGPDVGESMLGTMSIIWACGYMAAASFSIVKGFTVEVTFLSMFCALCSALCSWGYVLSTYV